MRLLSLGKIRYITKIARISVHQTDLRARKSGEKSCADESSLRCEKRYAHAAVVRIIASSR